MLNDDQQDELDRIESELETLQCQSEDCILIDDANDLMDALNEQVEEIDSIMDPTNILCVRADTIEHVIGLSRKIDTIINNLRSVLDKDKE